MKFRLRVLGLSVLYGGQSKCFHSELRSGWHFINIFLCTGQKVDLEDGPGVRTAEVVKGPLLRT